MSVISPVMLPAMLPTMLCCLLCLLQGKIRSVPLLSVHKIIQGQTTAVFRRDPLPEFEAVSFSLLYSEGKGSTKERSLDLVCRTTQEFETWWVLPA
jgi:hypothetical protein